VFALLSVEDNLRMGAFTRSDADGVAQDMEAVFGYFPILRERKAQEAGHSPVDSSRCSPSRARCWRGLR